MERKVEGIFLRRKSVVNKHLFLNEKAVSLVEVIAATVILAIIMISFFSFFIASKKISTLSNNTINYTNTTQMEIEKIYNTIHTTPLSVQDDSMKILSYTSSCIDNNSKLYMRTTSDNNIVLITKITPNITEKKLLNVLVSSYDAQKITTQNPCSPISEKPKIQMENIVKVGSLQ